MERSEQITLLKNAKKRSLELRSQLGDTLCDVLVSQLQFLLDLLEGSQRDNDKASKLSIGLIAAREIETLDEPFANILHKISGDVDSIVAECRSRDLANQ